MEMMKFTLENIHKLFGKTDVRISAQEYLKSFYEKFGFVKVSESYLEDDIPHIEMLRKNQD
jgi:ElaA protein